MEGGRGGKGADGDRGRALGWEVCFPLKVTIIAFKGTGLWTSRSAACHSARHQLKAAVT